jgi:SAM-dependent methyltransferase
MTATPPCQVCAASERRLFIRHQAMELFECRACGLVYLDPMPGAAELRALYRDGAEGATAGYFAKAASKLRRSRRRFRGLARRLPRDHGGRFLDVGSSGGFMVEAAREAGFEAWGIEPDGAALAYARRHYPDNHYVEGRLEDFDPGAAPFDGVYCSEVIEHAPDANRFMARIAALTRPGGVLYLTTPDLGHWRRPRDPRAWEAFSPPGHCLYFTPHNLTLLLGRHGFQVIKRRLAIKPGIKLLARRR